MMLNGFFVVSWSFFNYTPRVPNVFFFKWFHKVSFIVFLKARWSVFLLFFFFLFHLLADFKLYLNMLSSNNVQLTCTSQQEKKRWCNYKSIIKSIWVFTKFFSSSIKLQQEWISSIMVSLHSLHNLGDRSFLNELINELKYEDTTIICWTLPLKYFGAFLHHVDDARKVHGLK